MPNILPINDRRVVLCGVVALLVTLPGARWFTRPFETVAARMSDLTITMREYAFEMDSTLSPGKHVVALRNAGRHRHLVLLTRLAPGKTSSDVVEWLERRGRGMPGELVVASVELKSREESSFTVDLAPGRYSVVCTVRGWWNRPHYKSGMLRDIVVAEVPGPDARGSDTAAIVNPAR
jgi:plastocyanin